MTNLCPRCSQLGLSHECFKISANRNMAPYDLGVQSVQKTHERIDFGTMTQIWDSAPTCSLCDLIRLSVKDLLPEDRPSDVRCYLDWQVDGRTLDRAESQVNCTRRLRIGWEAEWSKQYEAHIILAAPESYDKSDVDYLSRVDDTSQFLGRRIGSKVCKKNLILQFLHLCEREHEQCKEVLGIKDPFAEILQRSYFGVIDIENAMLVPLDHQKTEDGRLSFAPYAAVSYVWGTTSNPLHSTRKANISHRRKSGGLADVINSLPVALKQSIDLVHAMGIRFIWIDSLCIVQDSGRNFSLNAKAMHSIYGNSTITICAAEGKDATTGLLALDEDKTEQVTKTIAQGINLMLHRPCEVSINATPWNSRGWTFQERLLSRRCLIFTDHRIFFQCRSTTISEDIFPDKQGKGWSLELVNAPLRMLPQLKTQALLFYMKSVSLYTKRVLSEPFDRLAAFSGMCSLMQETMGAPFTFGLPISHFDFAMLWQPTGKSRTLTKPLNKDDARYENIRFPTWSWSGWAGESAEYNRDMVKGCLSDVRRWLMKHTWIDWHIRSKDGTLRRLWQKECKEDRSEIAEWRGYCHPATTVAMANAIHTIDAAKEGGVDSESVAVKANGVLLAPTGQGRGAANIVNGAKGWGNGASLHRRPRDQRCVDHFGRSIRDNVWNVSHNTTFSLTLPEDPYRVCTRENNESPTSTQDQPLLQFFTWRKEFSLVRDNAATNNADSQQSHSQQSTESRRRSPINNGTGTAEPLSQCHIAHRTGDKCGSIKVDAEWLRKNKQTRFEFIAISEAKSFTDEEFPHWTFYIPWEKNECDWEVYFVLLVEYDETEGIYRRVALGKVFKAAFRHTQDEWKEIILG
ncbi:heterokaryon incompatibility protein-domain-containing protein [Xylaria bambusicola]|uniref:heterokaryon incompatibility protein-domain-containing protein n=1 Tax=Xylaria bambusicola TaxID=326684 RepID=UPI0020089A44|nr:heterokaryon incompatibility protein-domain-containing protein [Xylaria bambusicola]KAI0515083.1 heterokaryon incompatibility protein-domain-containing protein [Xylaria bambusicola]